MWIVAADQTPFEQVFGPVDAFVRQSAPAAVSLLGTVIAFVCLLWSVVHSFWHSNDEDWRPKVMAFVRAFVAVAFIAHCGDLINGVRQGMDQAEQRALHLIEEKGQRSPALDVVPGRKYTRLDPALLYQSLVAQYPQRQGEIDAFWRQHGTLSVDEARKLTGTLLQTDLNQFQGKGVEVLQRAPSLRLKR